MEMLYSGILTREQAAMIVNYRAAHHDIMMGIPTADGYNTHKLKEYLTRPTFFPDKLSEGV